MTTTLASPEQLAAWAANYHTDIDCRVRLQAALPDADRFMAALQDVRDTLQSIPTTEQRQEVDEAQQTATEAERAAREQLEAAQSVHRRARVELEQTTAAAIRCRKPISSVQMMLNRAGHTDLAIVMLDDELRERGFEPAGITVVPPADADWRKFTSS